MKKEQLISFTIPIELYEVLKVQSKRYGVSMSSIIRGAIWKEVDRIKK